MHRSYQALAYHRWQRSGNLMLLFAPETAKVTQALRLVGYVTLLMTFSFIYKGEKSIL